MLRSVTDTVSVYFRAPVIDHSLFRVVSRPVGISRATYRGGWGFLLEAGAHTCCRASVGNNVRDRQDPAKVRMTTGLLGRETTEVCVACRQFLGTAAHSPSRAIFLVPEGGIPSRCQATYRAVDRRMDLVVEVMIAGIHAMTATRRGRAADTNRTSTDARGNAPPA
ncbi:hypothetical protein BD413DRAFT_518977 [Trametes elegans]|nr:hypothetical protein BD413DRAFT_518977 [Trametes elegans]